MLGRPAEGLDEETLVDLFVSAFQEVLGPEGTLVLPAFSYSYPRDEVFDPASSEPKAMGLLTERLWRAPGVARSLDPIFSVIALGRSAAELTAGTPADCFGPDSIWARMSEADGVFCNIGLGSHSTFIHHVEQQLGVDYRYPKLFKGTTIVDGEPRETEISYFVRDLDEPRHTPYFMRLDRAGRAHGSVEAAAVGRGEINLVRARTMEREIRAGLERDPEFLVRGDGAD